MAFQRLVSLSGRTRRRYWAIVPRRCRPEESGQAAFAFVSRRGASTRWPSITMLYCMAAQSHGRFSDLSSLSSPSTLTPAGPPRPLSRFAGEGELKRFPSPAERKKARMRVAGRGTTNRPYFQIKAKKEPGRSPPRPRSGRGEGVRGESVSWAAGPAAAGPR